MKWTEFRHPGCQTTFHVKYLYEQDVKDVDHCPSCGKTGGITKEGVVELEGLLCSKEDITGR